jgi:N-acetylglutamate synthase-like GNAT family acetyltransferase
MSIAITLRIPTPAELAWINERYREIDFLPSAPNDYVAMAEVDGKPAGLGRIVEIAGRVGELGGMVVFDGFRGTGLAKEIVALLLETPGYDHLYCLPFARLEPLYASFGFRRVADLAGVPAKALDKYRWCAEFYPEPVLLMELRLATGACT